jgi:cytochrome b6-f complex iron-sulfur subunit
MVVAIAIALILVAAAAIIVFTANRRRTTGALSRETVARDRSREAVTVGAPGTELEAAGRERADDTKARLGGDVAVRRGGEVTEWEPVDEEEVGFHRRQFLTRALLGLIGIAGLAEFGPAVLAFLWPVSGGGFGGKIEAGSLDDILAYIDEQNEPFYVPNARSYVQVFPASALEAARNVPSYQPVLAGMEEGVTALFQRCVHLGCRVPWCETSQWFECPCHGSKYNAVGEKKDGPAPRGLDRFPVEIAGGSVVINTGITVQGPPIGVDTTKQQPEGPSCI